MNSISKSDYLPVPELRALQLAKLQKLVAYEYERVKLFRTRCDEKGVKPRDIVTLNDIRLLPFMKKTDLRDEFPFGLFASPKEEIVRIQGSSGTTGKPIVTGYTQNDIRVIDRKNSHLHFEGGLSKNLLKKALKIKKKFFLFSRS